MEDAWGTSDVADVLFEDKISLRQILASRMIESAEVGNRDRGEICADAIAFLRANYARRWRN
jgi:hypothetical protein